MIENLVTLADLQLMIPEIFVCAAAFALLMVDLFLSEQRRALTHFLALLILAAAAVLTVRELATNLSTRSAERRSQTRRRLRKTGKAAFTMRGAFSSCT